MKRKIVIAGSHNEFFNFLLDIPEENRKLYIYASEPVRLKGLDVDEVIHYGTWHKRPDLALIQEEADIQLRHATAS